MSWRCFQPIGGTESARAPERKRARDMVYCHSFIHCWSYTKPQVILFTLTLTLALALTRCPPLPRPVMRVTRSHHLHAVMCSLQAAILRADHLPRRLLLHTRSTSFRLPPSACTVTTTTSTPSYVGTFRAHDAAAAACSCHGRHRSSWRGYRCAMRGNISIRQLI